MEACVCVRRKPSPSFTSYGRSEQGFSSDYFSLRRQASSQARHLRFPQMGLISLFGSQADSAGSRGALGAGGPGVQEAGSRRCLGDCSEQAGISICDTREESAERAAGQLAQLRKSETCKLGRWPGCLLPESRHPLLQKRPTKICAGGCAGSFQTSRRRGPGCPLSSPFSGMISWAP